MGIDQEAAKRLHPMLLFRVKCAVIYCVDERCWLAIRPAPHKAAGVQIYVAQTSRGIVSNVTPVAARQVLETRYEL